jgi:hypothetical protein
VRRRVTQREAALLAALMDADGAVVGYGALGRVVGAGGASERACISEYVHRLRVAGVAGVETVGRWGLRMTAIPPDWALEDVLGVLRSMQDVGIEHLPIARLRKVS